MYQATAAFGNLVQQDSRTFKARITYGNITVENVKSLKFTGGSEAGDDFSAGSAVSQYVTVTIQQLEQSIEGEEFLLEIGMNVNGTMEYIPMGLFTAEKPKKTENQVEVTAYDRMLKMERPFSMDGSETTTLEILKKIQEITKVPVSTEGLSAKNMSVPKGYSCREVLRYIAQIYGKNAICSRSGQIEMHGYEKTDYTVSPGRYWGNFTHNEFPYNVEKLTCYTGTDADGKTISINAGSGTRAIAFSNPFMSQELLDEAYASLKSLSYMPGSVKMLGDPRLDVWDIITVSDLDGKEYSVPVMKIERDFDGGLTDSIEAVGLSEQETSADYRGPKTQEADRYYAQLVMVDQALVNKLDVDTAKITYATITNLNAANANIGKLTADIGDFKTVTAGNFSATNAKINSLDADYANIKTLLSGGAGIGDLQNIHLTSQNAVIDSALIRNAVMQTVAISDLLAGDISTNKFRIISDDGGIQISGATQQWRDANGTVRMQAGRDAKGNFTFSLFDASGKGTLIDASGVKANAIADGLIVNKMVADNAAIAGSKLDIPSVITAINGSSQSIKSSRIWMDNQNQSLNQMYTDMSKNITTVSNTAAGAVTAANKANETASAASSTANSASSTAAAASDTARKALETLSGISTLDAIGATLDNDAHVVHTYPDGTGGNYEDCHTTLTVYQGDTDVSALLDQLYAVPSAGVTGTWKEQTRTYQVTGLSGSDGYVDIFALYGTKLQMAEFRSGKKVVLRSGKYLKIRAGGAHITKRFSISKAPDGKVGVSYNLRVSSQAIRKQKDGKTLVPGNITFSGWKNDDGKVSSYAGKIQIEESIDSKTYTATYASQTVELMKIYEPTSADVKMIRGTLFDAAGTQTLDVQTVIILADAEGLSDDIEKAQKAADQAQAAIITTNQKVTTLESGMDGLSAKISETTTDLHGLTDNTLFFNVRYHDNGDETTTLEAIVYKNGNDVTKNYPENWYTWRRRLESGETYLGYGYSIKVQNSGYQFGGICSGRFTTYKTFYLQSRTGKTLVSRSGKKYTVWRE